MWLRLHESCMAKPTSLQGVTASDITLHERGWFTLA